MKTIICVCCNGEGTCEGEHYDDVQPCLTCGGSGKLRSRRRIPLSGGFRIGSFRFRWRRKYFPAIDLFFGRHQIHIQPGDIFTKRFISYFKTITVELEGDEDTYIGVVPKTKK